jgi:hypothetical protein
MLGADPRSLPLAVLAQQPCIRLVHSRLEDLAYLELLVGYLRMLPTLGSADLPAQARAPVHPPSLAVTGSVPAGMSAEVLQASGPVQCSPLPALTLDRSLAAGPHA